MEEMTKPALCNIKHIKKITMHIRVKSQHKRVGDLPIGLPKTEITILLIKIGLGKLVVEEIPQSSTQLHRKTC